MRYDTIINTSKNMKTIPPPKSDHEKLLDALWALNLLGCHYEIRWRNMTYTRSGNSTEEMTVKVDS